jgi:hypothetical protein
MREVENIGVVAHIIQLAVAPAFLLTAIGALLNVMTNRLARVIDRARLLGGRLAEVIPEDKTTLHSDLFLLSRRAKLIGLSITLCTATALLICTVIAILFLGNFMSFDISTPVALLFILGMLSLIVGLLIFLREIFLATKTPYHWAEVNALI